MVTREKQKDRPPVAEKHSPRYLSLETPSLLFKKNIIYIQYAFIYLLMEMGKVTSEDTRHWEGLSKELVPIFEEKEKKSRAGEQSYDWPEVENNHIREAEMSKGCGHQ